MFVQRVELAVRDGQEAAFEAALCEVRQQVFMTRGFRDFTVAQGVEEPGTYMVQGAGRADGPRVRSVSTAGGRAGL